MTSSEALRVEELNEISKQVKRKKEEEKIKQEKH